MFIFDFSIGFSRFFFALSNGLIRTNATKSLSRTRNFTAEVGSFARNSSEGERRRERERRGVLFVTCIDYSKYIYKRKRNFFFFLVSDDDRHEFFGFNLFRTFFLHARSIFLLRAHTTRTKKKKKKKKSEVLLNDALFFHHGDSGRVPRAQTCVVVGREEEERIVHTPE